MEFFNVASVEAARAALQGIIEGFTTETEIILLQESLHRFIAEDIIAKEDLPAYHRSTVDGYGVHWQDVQGASETIPSYLTLSGQVQMGTYYDKTLLLGEVVYIPTGGMVPEGVDGVVMIEYSEIFGEKDVLLKKSMASGENMTFKGDDVAAESIVLEAGRKMSPYDIGLLAGLGIAQVRVFKKPRFAILSTGDEIVDIHESTAKGAIRDMNGYVLQALLEEKGAAVTFKRLVKDDLAALQGAFKEALDKADHVLLSGGSSVGTKDFTLSTIRSFEGGEVLIHGIAIKPGKPTIIGKIGDQAIIGLPGHPAAAVLVCMQVVMPFIRQLINPIHPDQVWKERIVEAVITGNVRGTPGRETYQMVSVSNNQAVPIYAKSGILSQMTQANGYVVIPIEEEGVKKGETVKVHLYRE